MSPDELLSHVIELADDGGFQSEVAQLRAKATLHQVLDEVPTYNWSYVANRVVRNSAAALFEMETSLLSQGTSLPQNVQPIARRLAQAWESLSVLEEGTTKQGALINAALAYEIAGYQANASCLARSLVRPSHELRRHSPVELAALLLQRRLILLLRAARLSAKEPTEIPEDQASLVELAAEAYLGQALAAASGYLLRGDVTLLETAASGLSKAEESFSLTSMMNEANLCRGIRSLLPLIVARSTWAQVGNAVDDLRWNRYLKLLARGTGEDVLMNRSVTELWPSQIATLEGGLLSDWSSKVVRMPTSAGKTRIAELAMAFSLIGKGSKCVYVAPFRALAGEVEQTFLNLFADLGYRVSSVVGTYESDDFEQVLVADADVLVVTPEKLDMLIRTTPTLLQDVGLFVLDEGQLIDDRKRGIKFEFLLTRLAAYFPQAQFLFLSAVVSETTLDQIAAWLRRAGTGDHVNLDWRPSVQRVAKLEWRGTVGILRYASSEDSPLLGEFVPGVIRQESYSFVNPDTGRMNTRRFPAAGHKAQAASELAFKFSELGPTLVFCSQPDYVEAVGRALLMRLDLLQSTDQPIPSRFVTPSTRSAVIAAEWLGPNHPITTLLRSGIAIHHGKLPEKVRSAVEADFRERRYQVIAATGTLAQGVNLPLRTVVVHSVWWNEQDAYGNNVRKPMQPRDYWNVAGRAGRAGEETEGTIIHLVLSATDEADYQRYLLSRTDLPDTRTGLFQLLEDLASERLSVEAAAAELDAEVLALLLEEGADQLEAWAMDLVATTLTAKQAQQQGISAAPLRAALALSAKRIVEAAPSASLRGAFKSTGLPSRDCSSIVGAISEAEAWLPDLLRTAAPEQAPQLVEFVLSAASRAADLQPFTEAPWSHLDLLLEWLKGSPVNDLRTQFVSDSFGSEKLARFIEDFFGYKLPWGASAIFRLATPVLGIEQSELSVTSAFLPSMIKYGVPFPEAAWAMSIGIPFRTVAVQLGHRFLSINASGTYEDFTRWLGGIDSEDLSSSFGLNAVLLRDVNRSLSRAASNPLLEAPRDLSTFLPFECPVRGIGYESRRYAAQRMQEGAAVAIRRDYANQFDRNAVGVFVGTEQIGFLPRDIAQLLAPELDSGLALEGLVTETEPGDVPAVTILVGVVGSTSTGS